MSPPKRASGLPKAMALSSCQRLLANLPRKPSQQHCRPSLSSTPRQRPAGGAAASSSYYQRQTAYADDPDAWSNSNSYSEYDAPKDARGEGAGVLVQTLWEWCCGAAEQVVAAVTGLLLSTPLIPDTAPHRAVENSVRGCLALCLLALIKGILSFVLLVGLAVLAIYTATEVFGVDLPILGAAAFRSRGRTGMGGRGRASMVDAVRRPGPGAPPGAWGTTAPLPDGYYTTRAAGRTWAPYPPPSGPPGSSSSSRRPPAAGPGAEPYQWAPQQQQQQQQQQRRAFQKERRSQPRWWDSNVTEDSSSSQEWGATTGGTDSLWEEAHRAPPSSRGPSQPGGPAPPRSSPAGGGNGGRGGPDIVIDVNYDS